MNLLSLVDEREYLLSIFDSTFEGVMIHENGLIIDANAALSDLSGFSRDELMGMSGFKLLTPESAEIVKEKMSSGSEAPYEVVARRRDGSEIAVELCAKEIHLEGRAYRIVAIRDISDKKKTVEELKQSEEYFRVLVEASSECICKVDLDGRFQYMSPAGLRAHGLSQESEIAGRHCEEFVEPQYQGLLEESLREARNGLTQTFEYESRTVLGVRWFESILTPQLNGSGQVVGFIRLSRDIHDRKLAEKKLHESWNVLSRTLKGTVEALSSTAGLRDPYTADHQRRVAKLAEAIAERLGFDERAGEGVKVAGALHDLGKIYVPAEILSKPGILNEFEFKIIQAHAQASHDVLKRIEFPWPVAEAVLQHHERLDGSGYPAGLSGDEITIEAKIVAVADVVEAMSSRRPYRAGLGLPRALNEISINKGRLYDTEVSRVCLELFVDDGFDFREKSAGPAAD